MKCREKIVTHKDDVTYTLTELIGGYHLEARSDYYGHPMKGSTVDTLTVMILDDNENAVERIIEHKRYYSQILGNHERETFKTIKNDQEKVTSCVQLVRDLFEMRSDSDTVKLFTDRLDLLTYWKYGKSTKKQLIKKEKKDAVVVPTKSLWRRLFRL